MAYKPRERQIRGYLGLLMAFLLLSACARVGTPSGQPGRNPTPFEQALAINATLAVANESLADVVMAAEMQGFIPPATAAEILLVQFRIADLDKQITLILEKGPEAAKGDAAKIQELLGQIEQAAQGLIERGTLGITNPDSRQRAMVQVSTVLVLSQRIVSLLQLAGVF